MLTYNYGNDEFNKFVNVVFIQDYIVKAIESKGMSLDTLDGYLLDRCFRIEEYDKLGKWFNENLSKYDVDDLAMLNSLMSKYLINEYGLESDKASVDDINGLCYASFEAKLRPDGYANIRETTSRVLAALSNSNDIKQVLLNKNDIYKAVPTTNTLFIVVYSGFGNILGNPSIDVKYMLSLDLLHFLFKFYGRDKVINLPIYAKFLTFFFKYINVRKAS